MPYCYQCTDYIRPREERHRDVVTSVTVKGKFRTSRKPLCFVCSGRFDIKKEYNIGWFAIAVMCFFMIMWSLVDGSALPFLVCILCAIPISMLLYSNCKNELEKFNEQLEKATTTPISQLKEELEKIDIMTGVEFEYFCGNILKTLGYKITFTPASGDRGIDIIAEKNDRRLGVQTKRYFKKVNIKAIQEVVAGRLYYKVDDMLVITNSYFTLQALEIAKINNVTLWDKNHLKTLLTEIREFKEDHES